jgi:hypothetical protein
MNIKTTMIGSVSETYDIAKYTLFCITLEWFGQAILQHQESLEKQQLPVCYYYFYYYFCNDKINFFKFLT